MRSKLYVIHNTTDKVSRGEVSLHLNAFACPSPIKERKWGWIWRVSPGRVPPSKATFSSKMICILRAIPSQISKGNCTRISLQKGAKKFHFLAAKSFVYQGLLYINNNYYILWGNSCLNWKSCTNKKSFHFNFMCKFQEDQSRNKVQYLQR